jgi:hypothetical protein
MNGGLVEQRQKTTAQIAVGLAVTTLRN